MKYLFKGSNFILKSYFLGAGKVGHGDELNYLWRKSINSNLKDSPESDKKIVDQLSLMWTNFVKYL